VEDDDARYYRFDVGRRATMVRRIGGKSERILFTPDLQQSVLLQRRDPDLYPEVSALGRSFARILTFREWSFGRSVPLRQPQPADLPNDVVLPDARNLGLMVNAVEHSDAWPRMNAALSRFLPRFKRLTTLTQGETIQIFLHEDGLRTPVPATRLSDGTIRFIALLAILLRPSAAPLICLEEPELGLHSDAMTLIAKLLVEAAEKTQIVVTTHSDVLVSALSKHAESVVVCDNLAGASRFRRLESDKLRFWMDKNQLGEIWRAGELGGNP
jgi:predicted ATPase